MIRKNKAVKAKSHPQASVCSICVAPNFIFGGQFCECVTVIKMKGSVNKKKEEKSECKNGIICFKNMSTLLKCFYCGIDLISLVLYALYHFYFIRRKKKKTVVSCV